MALDIKAVVADFQQTNWKDPGTWSILPKLAVLLAILVAIPVAGFFGHWKNQIEEIEVGKGQEEKLKKEYIDKKRQAVNLDLLKQQEREVKTQFDALQRQLPNKSQMDALLIDINQAGLGRGLQFDLFKPAAESVKEFYAELPITVKVRGNYHDMGAFAADVGQLPRIVTLNDVSISAGKDGNLTLDAIARTYRYLDDDEVSAQRKAAAAARKGKKR